MSQGIVSNGRDRQRSHQQREVAIREIRARADSEFAPLLADAGFFRQLVLAFKRSRRVRAEIRALGNPHSMYVTRSSER